MLKKIFFLFLLFYCSKTFAQRFTPVIKTPINSFIECSDIKWAAYANSIQKFDTAFMVLLINKLKTGNIKATLPLEDGSSEENVIQYLPKPFIDSALASSEEENLKANYLSAEKRNGGLSIDPQRSYPELHQIFYVKKGKLYAYISRISLTKEIITTKGLHLGRGEILSTAINKKYNRKIKKRFLLLGSAKRKLHIDSIPATDMLKKQFNNNIVETLWPEVLTGKIKAYSVPDNVLLTTKELASEELGPQETDVPVYGETGELLGTKRLHNLKPNSFSKIILAQHFYFDKKKNVFLSKIPDAILYQTDHNKEEKAVLRIVF